MIRVAMVSLGAIMASLLSGHAAFGAPAGEDKQKSPFSMELSAGVEYDSNVSIDVIDANTSAGDYAALLDADFDYEAALGSDTDLTLSYGLSQSLHDEFSEFDLQNHLLSADIARDFGAVDAGATYRYINTRLDNNAFLSMQQVSPYVSRFLGKKLFVRADYTFSDKEFEDLPERDAEQHALGADFYYFLRGARTYLVLGYRYKDEDARDAQFDYRSHNVKLRLSQRFTIMDRTATFKIGWLHEARDYTSITPDIGEKRNDDRNRLQAALEVPINNRLFVALAYEYGDFSSDLASADYTQYVAGLSVGLKL